MSLVIEKLNSNNFDIYQSKIMKSLREEYKHTYNITINDNQLNQINNYCMSYMYILVFKTHEHKPKLIGYFSLSTADLNKTTNLLQYLINYIFGNVYLFDVYVYPKYRKKGIGTYLVFKSVQTAKKEFNAKKLYLYTKSNELTQFYNKNKFIYIKDVEIDNNKLLLFIRTIKN